MNDESATQLDALKWAQEEGAAKTGIVSLTDREVYADGHGRLLSLEEHSDKPYRIKASPKFTDVQSFATYIGTFKQSGTTLFGGLAERTVTGRIDYHGADPSWNTHSATLISLVTPEWEALTKANGVFKTQSGFADFLEEYAHIFIEPDNARILEVATNLSGSVNGTFQATVNRSNGSATFMYAEETVTNSVKVPTNLTVAVAPFVHSAVSNLSVLLRFKIVEKHPQFAIVLPTIKRIEYDALISVFGDTTAATGLPVLVGP